MGIIFAPFRALLDHKLKTLTVFGLAIFFMIIFFPNDDLADYVSGLVARTTGIYMQFDNFGLVALPGPGFDAENIVIEQKGLPALKAGGAHATLSILKALTLKAGASAELRKIFGGDISLDYAQDGKAKSGAPFDEINVHAQNVSLDSLMDFLAAANMGGPKIHGQAKLDLNKLRIDHGFGEQPSALASLDVPSLSFPAQTLMTQMGPQPIPTLELGRASLKNAKLSEGVLEIPDLTLGDPKGEFFAKIKGTMGLQMRKVGNAVNPEISNINLNIKMTADKDFVNHNRDLLNSFLLLMGSCKQDTPKGIDVSCNLKIGALGTVPTFTPMTEKL